MKLFKVTGWKQYMTDSATPVDRMQLAETAEEAIAAVQTQIYNSDGRYRYLLTAKEA